MRTVFDHLQPFAGVTLVVYGDEIGNNKFCIGSMNTQRMLFGQIIAAECAAAPIPLKLPTSRSPA